MEGLKAERLKKERTQAIRIRGAALSVLIADYAATQPVHAILPTTSDLVALEPFRTIIEHTPIEDEVTAAHFQDAMANFPSLVEDWRRSKDRELLELIKACPLLPEATEITESRLLFATTYFRCEVCEAEIGYPRILVHKCTRSLCPTSEVDDLFIDLGSTPWNYGGGKVSFYVEAYATAVTVLVDCNIRLDVTTGEMDAAYFRFECLSCNSEEKGRLVMRWPKVVCRHVRIGAHRQKLMP